MKTKFTTITLFVLMILGANASGEQKKSETVRLYLAEVKNVTQAKGTYSNPVKYFSFIENQLSVPGNSEDYSWDEDANGWQHVSNTTYTYNSTGKLIDEVVQEPETDMYISRVSYAYDLSGNIIVNEEFIFNPGINQWFLTSGMMLDYTINAESQINGVIEKTWENGVWVNKTKTEYILDANNIPMQLRTYHWNGADWSLYSRTGLLTWADWEKRELLNYTVQYWHDNNWVNGERYSKQYIGNNYTATTEVWENGDWVNSVKETYSITGNQEELILENRTEQGWEKTEKYRGTFDDIGNPTGMQYSAWHSTNWVVEMELFLDLSYNELNDVTEMVVRYWDLDLTAPVNLSKYIYSNFQHFTTSAPEITNLQNVNVFPNPVKNSFTIQFDENKISNYQVKIVNVAGQTIFSDSFTEPAISINAESFPSGMYLLNIKSDEGSQFNSKLLKH